MEKNILSDEELKYIPIFENFLKKIGFKRVDGAIFGLLVLSERPLTSPEIEKALNLSQSATSTSLKTLSHYGAIETIESRESRLQIHSARLDMLSIVSAIFSKRDQEDILNLKKTAKKILEDKNVGEKSQKRLESIILTCEIAESVMNFVMGLSHKQIPDSYPQIIKRLPKALDLLTQSVDITTSLKDLVASRLLKKSSSQGAYEN
jgi:DNA-binding transcriptional regulator GbsR (MarR family)